MDRSNQRKLELKNKKETENESRSQLYPRKRSDDGNDVDDNDEGRYQQLKMLAVDSQVSMLFISSIMVSAARTAPKIPAILLPSKKLIAKESHEIPFPLLDSVLSRINNIESSH